VEPEQLANGVMWPTPDIQVVGRVSVFPCRASRAKKRHLASAWPFQNLAEQIGASDPTDWMNGSPNSVHLQRRESDHGYSTTLKERPKLNGLFELLASGYAKTRSNLVLLMKLLLHRSSC
jgi:hypothetical protein